MKAIAIFEIDEKVFDELSNEKLSMRLLWNFDTMLVEKSKYFDDVILSPLPEKHGKIGDIDRLYEVFKKNVVGADAFKELFDIAPTIIKADKGEKDNE